MNSGWITSGLALALLTAGCAGALTESPAPASGSEAAQPSVSADTGSIAGRVLNDESLPIAGAEIGAREINITRSDDNGRFTINAVPPGSYTLTASRLGFKTKAQRVEVSAGETTSVSFVLAAVAVETGPRSEFKIHEGYIAGPALSSWFAYSGAGGSVSITVTPGAHEVFMAMKWDANTATTARYLGLSVSFADLSNRTVGRSPIHTNITGLEVTKDSEKTTARYYITYKCNWNPIPDSTCLTEDAEYLVPVVVYEQRLTLYSTVFYASAHPPGYTGLPP